MGPKSHFSGAEKRFHVREFLVAREGGWHKFRE